MIKAIIKELEWKDTSKQRFMSNDSSGGAGGNTDEQLLHINPTDPGSMGA